jgi:hypothetical protein
MRLSVERLAAVSSKRRDAGMNVHSTPLYMERLTQRINRNAHRSPRSMPLWPKLLTWFRSPTPCLAYCRLLQTLLLSAPRHSHLGTRSLPLTFSFRQRRNAACHLAVPPIHLVGNIETLSALWKDLSSRDQRKVRDSIRGSARNSRLATSPPLLSTHPVALLPWALRPLSL